MSEFATTTLPPTADAIAPDGSAVRLLHNLAGGGMAHFELAAGEISVAVLHRTIEEIWYVLSGAGEMWRRLGDREAVVRLVPGVSLTLPLGTQFQFRADRAEPLRALGVSMPPWPGPGEAYEVQGKWPPTVAAGPG